MGTLPALTDIFVQIFQGPVNDADALRATYERWFQELAAGADGWLGATGGISEEGEFIALVRFASEEAARRNSQRPEQDAWWTDMETHFAGDVTFHNCDEVSTFGEQRPNGVGYVQMVQGRVANLAEALEQVGEQEQEHIYEHHLDMLGGLIADHGDGGFTEIIYYPSPAAAYEDESGRLPEVGVTLIDTLVGPVTDARFFHLRDPLLHRH